MSLKEGHSVTISPYFGSVLPIPINSTRALSSSYVHLCLFTSDFRKGLTSEHFAFVRICLATYGKYSLLSMKRDSGINNINFNLSLTFRFRLLNECLSDVTGDAHLLENNVLRVAGDDVLRTRFFSGFDGVVPEGTWVRLALKSLPGEFSMINLKSNTQKFLIVSSVKQTKTITSLIVR